MERIPLISMVGTGVWIVACMAIAAVTYARRKPRRLLREHGFFLGGLACLALTPGLLLLRHGFGVAPSISGGIVPLVVAAVFFSASLNAKRQRLNPEARSLMTFREKSAGVTLVATAFVYLTYLYSTWNATLEVAIPVFIVSVVLIVIILTIGHIVIAVFHSPMEELDEAPDERDKEAQKYGMRNAYYLLAVGIWAVPILSIMSFPPLVVANTAFAVVVLSELAKYGSLLFFYRFGNR
jgi:hypothetical protein